MRKLSIISIVLALVLISRCGIRQDERSAELVVTSYLEAIKADDFEKALSLYSPRFFQKTSREEWKSVLENFPRKLGAMQSYKLIRRSFKKVALPSGSGTYLTLQYKVRYAKHPSTETFIVFRPLGGEFKILSHNISSMGFLKE